MKFSIEKIIFSIAILSLPLLSVFALAEKVSLPLFIFLLLFIISFNKIKFKAIDFFYFSFIVFLIFSTVINNFINKSSLLYISSFVILYLVFQKNIIFWYSKHSGVFYKMLYYALMTTSLFVVYEFITLNFIPNLFIELPRQTVDSYGATFLGLFYRPRGFAEESGHMSLFYEFCVPLLIPYIRNLKFSYKIGSILIVLIALILLSSSFTIFISVVILSVYLFFKSLKNSKVLIICSTFVLSFILFIFINKKSRNYVDKYSSAIFNKVSLNDKNNSVNDRTIRFEEAIGLVKDNFFIGIGAFAFEEHSTSASSLNMTLDIWMFSGILGFLSFGFFIFVTCLNYYNSSSPNKLGVFLSLFILIIHYQIITNYWYPFLWILFGMMQAETKKYKPLKTL